jgi:hypothetical protein
MTNDITEFLTTRRATITPAPAGLPTYGKRRVPGGRLRLDDRRSWEGGSASSIRRPPAGILLIELAIAFVLRHPAVTAAIIGHAQWSTASPSSRQPTSPSPRACSTGSMRSWRPA